MMMIRIEILDGPEEGVAHSFEEQKLCLGSASDNHVHLTGEGVMSKHALLQLEDGQGRLMPGGNPGVMSINGTPVSGTSLLQPGDEICLGTQTFRYRVVPFPRPLKERRIALLEWITLGILITGALGQVYFLLGTARKLRSGVDVELLRATPTPLPTPNVVEDPTPTPEPPSLIELPTALPTALPEEEPPPGPHDPEDGVTAAGLTSEARRLSRNGEELKAERVLRQALELDRSYLPAKVELAKMLGNQAEFAGAIALWEEILVEAPSGSMTERDAKLELQVIRRRQRLLEQKTPDVPRVMPTPRVPEILLTPKPTPVPVQVQEAPAQVVVQQIRAERFPESPHYDALRMIYFNLAHQRGTPAVEAGKTQVVVNFYEQQGEKVIQARIPEPRILIKLDQSLAGGKVVQGLSAAYDVPKGKGDPARSYFGVVIQVLVDGKEVGRNADPVFLLDLMK